MIFSKHAKAKSVIGRTKDQYKEMGRQKTQAVIKCNEAGAGRKFHFYLTKRE